MLNDTWVFNFATLEWTQKTVKHTGHGFPRPRDLASGVYLEDKCHMFGGEDSRTRLLNELWVLDLR